jgi:hypothetical protein
MRKLFFIPFLFLVNFCIAQQTYKINAGGTSIAQSYGSSNFISLKASGILSDASLDTGQTSFGTDQTAAIQAILNTASKANPLNLLWDVKASCTGLKIKSYTTITALPGCGAILRDSSDNSLLSNYNWTANSNVIVDSFITINGGTWNGDGWRGGVQMQANNTIARGQITVINFFGVKNVSLTNCTFLYAATWCVAFMTSENVYINNCIIDDGPGYYNQDGIDFLGYAKNITITNCRIRNGDDKITFCPNSTGGTYTAGNGVVAHHEVYTGVDGDQTNIRIDNIYFDQKGKGFAFYVQGGNKVSDVHVSNITGTCQSYWLGMDNYLTGYTITSGSQICHNITFENISVEVTGWIGYGAQELPLANIRCSVDNLTFRNVVRTNWDDNGPTFGVSTASSAPAVTIGTLTIDNYITDNNSPSNFPGNVSISSSTVKQFNLINSNINLGQVNRNVITNYSTGVIGVLNLSNNRLNYLYNFLNNSGTISYLLANNIAHTNGLSGNATFLNTGTISNATFSNIICKQLTSGTFANADSTNIITY